MVFGGYGIYIFLEEYLSTVIVDNHTIDGQEVYFFIQKDLCSFSTTASSVKRIRLTKLSNNLLTFFSDLKISYVQKFNTKIFNNQLEYEQNIQF